MFQAAFCSIKIGFFPVGIIPCVNPSAAETAHESDQGGVAGTHGCMDEQRDGQNPLPPRRGENHGCSNAGCDYGEGGQGHNRRKELMPATNR